MVTRFGETVPSVAGVGDRLRDEVGLVLRGTNGETEETFVSVGCVTKVVVLVVGEVAEKMLVLVDTGWASEAFETVAVLEG